MSKYSEKLRKLAVDLFKINAIKFGEFTTKSGIVTPVYCDLRVIISYPELMENLTDLIIEKYGKEIKNSKLICGVPYTALPIATVISMKQSKPMVMRRKEKKDYGTKKLIEGVFNDGDTCLIIEDVVTSGSSILETVKDLTDSGMKCTNAIVLLNREQGGESILSQNGIKMNALLSLTELIDILVDNKHISVEIKQLVHNYIKEAQVNSSIAPSIKQDRLKLSYIARSQLAKNKITANLLYTMAQKETNLCVAADLTETTKILNLAEEVGPFICAFKTHIDIIEDFHPNFLDHLKQIAKRYEFILFEDRKFADIGQTVNLQFNKGNYKISSWAELVTAHSLFGSATLDAIRQENTNKCSVFLLAEASSSGTLIDEKYTNETIKLATSNQDVVTGVVCQKALFENEPGLVQLIPGVRLGVKGDNLGQQYNTPEVAILERGGDVAVVGRGITASSDPRKTAKNYRDLLWNAYLKRIE